GQVEPGPRCRRGGGRLPGRLRHSLCDRGDACRDGPAFIVSSFISWFVPAAALVAGYVFYLHTRAVREQVNAAELQRTALEKQQLETRLCLLQAQIEPHFLFNTLSDRKSTRLNSSH